MFISGRSDKRISEYKIKKAFELNLIMPIFGPHENIRKVERFSVALTVFIIGLRFVDSHEVFRLWPCVSFSFCKVLDSFFLCGEHSDHVQAWSVDLSKSKNLIWPL